MMRLLSSLAAVMLVALTLPPAGAQVLPERDACRPTTSARSRDGNCMVCNTGPVSTRPGFHDLVAKVRSRAQAFDEIDRRIDGASSDPEVRALLRGRNLARALMAPTPTSLPPATRRAA